MTSRSQGSRLSTAAVFSLAVFSTPVYSGGLYIGEFGQPNQGASRAGANALAEDASTAFHNPAGTMFLDETKAMGTVIGIFSKIEFDQNSNLPPDAVTDRTGLGPASDGGDAGSTAVGGAFFYASPVNDKWGWSAALTSISGAQMDYDPGEDFAGRYWATEVKLFTVTMAPSVSYRINDELSVGASLSVMYATLDMDVAIPGPSPLINDGLAEISNGDDTGLAAGVSAMWQATDDTRLGFVYQSETALDFDSDLDVTPPGVFPPGSTVASNVEFTFPQTLRASMAHDYNDKLTLLASVAWEDWSVFDEIAVSTPAGSGALPRNWNDTYHVSLGMRVQMDPKWTYYTGIAYDSDPTKASDRTADMPIDEQWRLSGGATYTRDNGHKVGGVLTYADYGSAKIDNGGTRPGGTPWNVSGDYSTNRIIFAGLNYGW